MSSAMARCAGPGSSTAEFYQHLSGVRPLPAERLLGAGAHDQEYRFDGPSSTAAPEGPRRLRQRLRRRPCPTPPKATNFLETGDPSGQRLLAGPGYGHRNAAAEAFVPILRAEIEGLVGAGAPFIQIDDPSPAIHPDAPSDFAALFNASIQPAIGRARLGAHLCFGNYLGRPLAPRTYRPVLDAMLGFRVDELAALEFANCEMAEVSILGDRGRGPDVAAGVVDVKNSHLESAAEVAARIDLVLAAGGAARASLARPGLRLQPDGTVGHDGEAPGTRRRPRPGHRPGGRDRRAMTIRAADRWPGVGAAAWNGSAAASGARPTWSRPASGGSACWDPALRAWVELDAEGAMAEARRRDEDVEAGELTGPLDGVPMGIKDIIDVAGLPTRAGSADGGKSWSRRESDAHRWWPRCLGRARSFWVRP